MILLSQILNDLATDCKMPTGMFARIWQGILQSVAQRKIQSHTTDKTFHTSPSSYNQEGKKYE